MENDIGYTKLNLGYAYVKLGRLELAKQMLNEAYTHITALKDTRGLAEHQLVTADLLPIGELPGGHQLGK